ncbi:MAG: peptidoglycan DD-metalloendopeptidase family protein [Pseudohongiellaceae bacterium]
MKASLQDSKPKLKLSLFFVFTCFFGASFAAENGIEAQQELAAVGDAIDEIQSWLREAKSTQSLEIENLQQAELEISTLSQSVTDIESQLAQTESEIATLTLQSTQLNARKTAQGEILAQTIRTAYLTGNQSAIELLLNQDDVSRSARMLHYHRLFSEAQLDSIEAFQKTLDELESIGSSLASKAGELEAEQSTLGEALESLNQSKRQREIALSQLREDIASRSTELEQLEIDQLQLQALIEEINRAVADIPAAMRRSPFNSQRGKLSMPVQGEIISRYGSRYGDGDLRRQGITIGVSEGTPVQAIHPGRVVFSDWLRGTGLLVIVDHGEGYMSLYGANQALSKQAGDWVDAGEIVSTSGFTNELTRGQDGGQARPGMYFEIRHHGEARNPTDWFSN